MTGRSGAMIADSVHSLSDFATDVVVLLGFQVVKKPVDKSHDYGHGKFETLVTTIIGLGLLWVGGAILWVGTKKIVQTTYGHALNKPGWIAFYAAIISIAVKEWLYQYTVIVGKKINSQAIIANAWHHRSDALSSVGTMLGIGGAILLGEKWRVLDPIAAIIVSFFIIQVAISISAGSINELLEASLNEETEKEILQIIKNTPGAQQPHSMKTRKIGNNIAIDIHVKVDKFLNVVQAHDIATLVEERLKDSFGRGTFISVHIEPMD